LPGPAWPFPFNLGAVGGYLRCAVQPLVDALREVVLDHNVVHGDETPVKVLMPGVKKTHRAYVRAYSSSAFADIKAVGYDFTPMRAGEHARRFLEGW
jgi:transposase